MALVFQLSQQELEWEKQLLGEMHCDCSKVMTDISIDLKEGNYFDKDLSKLVKSAVGITMGFGAGEDIVGSDGCSPEQRMAIRLAARCLLHSAFNCVNGLILRDEYHLFTIAEVFRLLRKVHLGESAETMMIFLHMDDLHYAYHDFRDPHGVQQLLYALNDYRQSDSSFFVVPLLTTKMVGSNFRVSQYPFHFLPLHPLSVDTGFAILEKHFPKDLLQRNSIFVRKFLLSLGIVPVHLHRFINHKRDKIQSKIEEIENLKEQDSCFRIHVQSWVKNYELTPDYVSMLERKLSKEVQAFFQTHKQGLFPLSERSVFRERSIMGQDLSWSHSME